MLTLRRPKARLLSHQARRSILSAIYVGACIGVAIRMMPITASWAALLVGLVAQGLTAHADSLACNSMASFLSIALAFVGTGIYLSPAIISWFAIKYGWRYINGECHA